MYVYIILVCIHVLHKRTKQAYIHTMQYSTKNTLNYRYAAVAYIARFSRAPVWKFGGGPSSV